MPRGDICRATSRSTDCISVSCLPSPRGTHVVVAYHRAAFAMSPPHDLEFLCGRRPSAQERSKRRLVVTVPVVCAAGGAPGVLDRRSVTAWSCGHAPHRDFARLSRSGCEGEKSRIGSATRSWVDFLWIARETVELVMVKRVGKRNGQSQRCSGSRAFLAFALYF